MISISVLYLQITEPACCQVFTTLTFLFIFRSLGLPEKSVNLCAADNYYIVYILIFTLQGKYVERNALICNVSMPDLVHRIAILFSLGCSV